MSILDKGTELDIRLAEEKIDQYLQDQGPGTVRLGIALAALRRVLLKLDSEQKDFRSDGACLHRVARQTVGDPMYWRCVTCSIIQHDDERKKDKTKCH